MRPRLSHRCCLVFLLVVAAVAASAAQLNRTQLWADQEIHAGWRLQRHVVFGVCRLLDREQAARDFEWRGNCRAALAQAKLEQGLTPESRHLVLLLHGMGRSTYLFRDMERSLRDAGYEAVAISYPSLTDDIAGHAAQIEEILSRAEDVEKVSFVTHSLGGLVLREMLSRDGPWQQRLPLGRVVMIAPPNQGSALAEALSGFTPFHWIGGPSASQIAAGPPFAPLPEAVELAVIAGGTEGGGGFNPLLTGNNDGLVTVGETALPGARDHMTIRALHTVIAGHPKSIAATINFLGTGRLRRSAAKLNW